MKQKLFLIVIVLCTAAAFAQDVKSVNTADDWYVCLGSFKSAANARQFSSILKEQGLPNTVTVRAASGSSLYRVLYDQPFGRRDDARIFRNGLLSNNKIHLLKLSGLWICGADSVLLGEVLQKNDGATLPISEGKPYSLKVRSYKEEHPAQQNSERLRANNIDAYVVKTYDDNAYFSFDVHAGAFASPDESAEMADALAALGIDNAKLSDYADIKEKMLRYDEVVQQDNVVFETAENATLPEFSEAVRTCLADLPVNRNFLIESIAIVDFETLATTGSKDLNRFKSLATPGDLNLDDFESLTTEDAIRAISKVVYFDDLFGKRVEVSVIKRIEPFLDADFNTETQFSLPDDDVLYANISSDGTVRTVESINTDKTLLIKIDAHNFSDDEFTAFLNNAWSDSAMVIYPQLRKSLCILPKNRENRHFVAFTLTHVKEAYAVAKGYADWAIPKVGHWMTGGYFLQGNKEIKIRFFDMDYEHNAQRNQEMFDADHRRSIISDTNHPTTVNETGAWYGEYNRDRIKQIAFSIKSFIVCVDTDTNSSIDEDGLNAFASELAIWKQ